MTEHGETDPSPSAVPIPDGPGELAAKMGIEITLLTAERAEAAMPVEGNRQPFGLLHGGASAALAETIGSVHAMHHAGPGLVPVGVELNCTHHRAARNGRVSALCVPLHVGRTLATFEIVVSDATARRICTARLTVAFIPARPAQ